MAMDKEREALAAEIIRLRQALRFYAHKEHFDVSGDPDAWDTVSGEPPNFWCDEAGTATIEDGTIAKMALRGGQVDWDGEPPEPIEGESATIAALSAQQAGEPVATVQVGPHDHGPFVFRETAYGADSLPNGEHKLYAAPPSGVREGMLRAAEMCRKRAEARWEEHGVTESDTNASYYPRAIENEMGIRDEEDDDCANAITHAAERVNAEGADRDSRSLEKGETVPSAPPSAPHTVRVPVAWSCVNEVFDLGRCKDWCGNATKCVAKMENK